MTTRELMEKYQKSSYTVTIWRRGYYIKSYKGTTTKIWLLPDHSTIPCEWVKDETTGRKRWEYNPIKVAVWLKKLADYRGEPNE